MGRFKCATDLIFYPAGVAIWVSCQIQAASPDFIGVSHCGSARAMAIQKSKRPKTKVKRRMVSSSLGASPVVYGQTPVNEMAREDPFLR
jgi:hypothetical protein